MTIFHLTNPTFTNSAPKLQIVSAICFAPALQQPETPPLPSDWLEHCCCLELVALNHGSINRTGQHVGLEASFILSKSLSGT